MSFRLSMLVSLALGTASAEELRQERYLVLDSRIIDRVTGAQLTLGQYYMGDPYTHHSWRDAGLCLARLPPDGFAGYEPIRRDAEATVLTRPIRCGGQSLRISADVRGGGSIRLMLADENGRERAVGKALTSRPAKWQWRHEVNTEWTDQPVEWTDAREFSALNGKQVRLKFVLKNAKLYSFSSRETNSGSRGFRSPEAYTAGFSEARKIR